MISENRQLKVSSEDIGKALKEIIRHMKCGEEIVGYIGDVEFRIRKNCPIQLPLDGSLDVDNCNCGILGRRRRY